MRTQPSRSLCLFVLPALSFAFQYQTNYGYVGPACAVADGVLFLHGEAQRELTPSESEAFRHYQRDLSIFLELKKKFPILEPPKMPSFCGSLSDAAELVLESCIVRDGMVYIDGREVRRITDEEERKVDEILGPWSRRRRMKRRGTREISTEPGYSPLCDISIFLDRFLNVNPTVTKRFAPWFQHSPLVSGSEPGLSYGPSSFVSPKHLERPIVPKPIKPGGYGVKRRPASRWEAEKLSENNAPVNKTETIIVPNGKNSYPSTATSTPSSEVITTTKQTLLQFLAKSLTDPELVRTLKEIEKAHLGHAPLQSYSKKEGTPAPNEPDFLPDPVAKWFTRTTEEPNDVEEHLSFLPDEICTAHMKKSSIKRLTHI